MNPKLVISLYINFIIFVLTTISTIWMMSGINLSKKLSSLTSTKLGVFKFFTVDSNVFAGLVSLILFMYLIKNGNAQELPKILWILKLMSTSGVTITLLVTCFYLAPTSKHGYMSLFRNSNFFFHLVIPLLCILSFVFYEGRTDIPNIQSIYGILPILLYAFYYVGTCLSHIENGTISSHFDFYRFFTLGSKYIPIIVIILFGLSWNISFVLTWLNRICC